MNQASLTHAQVQAPENAITRRFVQSDNATVLADIYRDDINIATWKRTLSEDLLGAAMHMLGANLFFRISTSVTPTDTFDSLYGALGESTHAEVLAKDIAEIVGMFCCLFELEQVGLRLTVLDRAMCPKFHVDRVPCRLVTTYSGIATEWLSHQDVNRKKLGVGSQGKSDERSGLYQNHTDIHRLKAGDIALLKGESWSGNEGAGLVHRSPTIENQEKRLLLTLDFI